MQSPTFGFVASPLALAVSLALISAGVAAQTPKAEDHTAHHPAEAASAPKPAAKPAPAKAQPAAADKVAMEKMGLMDAKMKAMQDMHQKFMAAKTPEERMALMPEHMKAMQDAMTMMEDMRASKGDKGGMGMGMMGDKQGGMGKMSMDMMSKHQLMEKRMDMMQSMMQMMMDRMALSATK